MPPARLLALVGAGTALTVGLTATAPWAQAGQAADRVDHIVVIYEENHSFDNLYGTWGDVHGEHVDGLGTAAVAQLGQDGRPLGCLFQNDVNLTSPDPLPTTCTDNEHPVQQGGARQPVSSHFGNAPFRIEDYIGATDTTCPAPGSSAPHGVRKGTGAPGGCTEDLVHRFYQEQWQSHDGRQDRYVAGSDAAGLAMGHYDTTQLPIYRYLHGPHAPRYVLADRFFQGAWGGSFLNHQMLVAAQAPVFPGADRSGRTDACGSGTTGCDLHSVVDAEGFPAAYPYYSPATAVKDNPLTEAADADGRCTPSYAGAATPPAGTVCGDYAVNTIQPFTQPYSPGTPVGRRLPLLQSANIGDALTAKQVSWAWYAGGWDNAAGNNGHDALHPRGPGWTNGDGATCQDPASAPGATFPYCADRSFQFHHQPLGYFAHYADGTPGRAQHLKDEQQFVRDVRAGRLPSVSFVKPVGEENEHPGYASESTGSDHLVDLLKTIADGPQARHTMVVVTYDEFGGQWDHVAPPGTAANPGVHDAFGPGTRVPALVLSPALPASGVDHTPHDTTSILATIEHRFGLAPLTDRTRDRYVRDLFTAFTARRR